MDLTAGIGPFSDDAPSDDEALTDDELTALALSADPDAALSSDAVPYQVHLARVGTLARASLPGWYMAPATALPGRRWRTPVILTVVAAFLLIDALGLCNTFGVLSLA